MPTLCRSATLPAKTTISKWRVAATIRQLLQLLTGGTISFRGLKSNSIPPSLPPKHGIALRHFKVSFFNRKKKEKATLRNALKQRHAPQQLPGRTGVSIRIRLSLKRSRKSSTTNFCVVNQTIFFIFIIFV